MANTRYQLEGNAPQLYERETVHTLGRPLAELMFAHVSLHAGDRVLDAACGTGIVTRVAAQRCGHPAHIVGVDLNPGMLDVARSHTPATGVPVTWRQGDLCALPFPDGSFDIVLCQQGLQFVPDPGTALREMHRVLVPGGRLAFTVFSEVPVYYAVLADALARHVSAAAATSCLSRYTLQEATTLQALELTNGSSMDNRLKRAGQKLLPEVAKDPSNWIERTYRQALSRDPSTKEREVALETIGQPVTAEGIADFLWAITMLPEFQLID